MLDKTSKTGKSSRISEITHHNYELHVHISKIVNRVKLDILLTLRSCDMLVTSADTHRLLRFLLIILNILLDTGFVHISLLSANGNN